MKIKHYLKQSEIGLIPENWNVASFGSLFTDFRGGAPLKPSDFKRSGIKVLPKGGVGRSGWLKVSDDDIQYCSQEYAAKYSRNQVDNLFTIIVLRDLVPSGPSIGLIVNIREPETYVLAQGVYGFKLTESAVSSYLVHLSNTQWYRKLLNSIMVGSTQVHVTNTALKRALIPIPPKEEQIAISNALNDASSLIESLEKLIEKKRQIKQGAIQELLTGKKRLPGFSGEWLSVPLSEVAKIQRGASPRPIESPIWFDENSTVGWVRISDVTSSTMYLTETSQKLSQAGIKNSRPVKKGGLIMSICATIGRPIITLVDVCIHDGFVVFDELKINKKLLYYILKFIEPDWSKHGQTGSQMNLNTGLINQTIIAFPKTDTEQIEISEVLTSMDDELSDLDNKLNKARQLKQGMMQELLAGRIRLV